MKRLLVAAVIACCISKTLEAEVTGPNTPLRKALADSLYCKLAGCTMTGKLRVINGTALAPSIDAAVGGSISFIASGISVNSGGNANSVIGQGMATVSGGSYGFTSSATDPTGTADLKLIRVAANKIGWAGATAAQVTHDFSSLTATRIVTWPNSATSVPIAAQQLTFAGPTSARTVTFPDANFTAARTDAGNQFTGNQGIGVAPSGTTGDVLLGEVDGDNGVRIIAKNTNAAGTGAFVAHRNEASTSTSFFASYGAGYTLTALGLTLGSYAEIGTSTGNGLIIDTRNATPIVLGTNNVENFRIASGGAITTSSSIAPSQTAGIIGTTTNNNANAGSVGEFTNAQCPGPTVTATITVTIASPGVVTWSGHPFSGTAPRFDACPVVFTTTGALPTGITASTTYWVIPSTISGNTFSIATSVANAIAGTAINTSGTQSGTQTGTAGSVLTSATPKDVIGFALTAGDWDCTASLVRGLGATTSITILKSSINTTSATDGTLPAGTMDQFATAANIPANDVARAFGPVRLLNSATTNTFLVADDTFSASTNKAYGTLRCRRKR